MNKQEWSKIKNKIEFGKIKERKTVAFTYLTCIVELIFVGKSVYKLEVLGTGKNDFLFREYYFDSWEKASDYEEKILKEN